MPLTNPPAAVAAPPDEPSRLNAPSVFITRANAFIAWFAPLRAFLASLVAWYTDTAKPELEALQADVTAKHDTVVASAADVAADAAVVAAQYAQVVAAADAIDDRYLGPKAADPVLDNDGNALQPGTEYFNTTTNEKRVYTTLGTWQTPAVPPAGYAMLAGNQFTDQQDWKTGAPIASAAVLNLNATGGNRVHVTGATAITSVTLNRGPITVIFDGALTLTHHPVNNCLPGGANITTAAGDVAIYEGDGAVVRCVTYTKASGRSVASEISGMVASPITVADALTATFASQPGDSFIQAVVIDADRDMLIFGSNNNLHAVVLNHTLNTIGSPALIRTSATPQFRALLSAANQVLVVSWAATAIQANVLTITGNSISVGANATAVATALGNAEGFGSKILQVGASYVFAYSGSTTVTYARAMTIAGTTVTIGAELALTTAATAQSAPALFLVGGAVLVALVITTTFLYAIPITVSAGTTLTQGTIASIAATAISGFVPVGALASGRILVGYMDTQLKFALASVAGTVATLSAGVAISGGAWTNGSFGKVIGSQFLFLNNGTVQVVTDNAGAVAWGTTISGPTGSHAFFIGNAMFVRQLNTNTTLLKYEIAGNNPALTAAYVAPVISASVVQQIKDLRNVGQGFDYTNAPETSPLISASRACSLQGTVAGAIVFGALVNSDGSNYLTPHKHVIASSVGALVKTSDSTAWACDQQTTTQWTFKRAELT